MKVLDQNSHQSPKLIEPRTGAPLQEAAKPETAKTEPPQPFDEAALVDIATAWLKVATELAELLERGVVACERIATALEHDNGEAEKVRDQFHSAEAPQS